MFNKSASQVPVISCTSDGIGQEAIRDSNSSLNFGDWIVRGVLGLKRKKPAWFDLPVMMKLTLSTPTSRVEESCQRAANASEQFYDASANIALRTPPGC